MSDPQEHPIDSHDAAELRRSLASAAAHDDDDDAHAAGTGVPMTRDEALLRLADALPDDAFASVHLAEVALTNRDVAVDLRAGKPAKFFREWTVLITAPGYSHNHAGDELAPVVEQALADYRHWRGERDAEDWARTAIPDQPAVSAAPAADKPPKLTAPGTAEERQREQDRGKDVG